MDGRSLDGGEPTFQSLRFAELRFEVPALAALRDEDACPALLLEVLGPHLRVSALAWMPSGHVLCEPLTPLLHALPLTGQPRQLDDLVRVLAALRRALEELRAHYTRTVARLPPVAATAKLPTIAAVAAAAANSWIALPYPLQDDAVFENVAHLSPGKLLYDATRVANAVCASNLRRALMLLKCTPPGRRVGLHPSYWSTGCYLVVSI